MTQFKVALTWTNTVVVCTTSNRCCKVSIRLLQSLQVEVVAHAEVSVVHTQLRTSNSKLMEVFKAARV